MNPIWISLGIGLGLIVFIIWIISSANKEAEERNITQRKEKMGIKIGGFKIR